MLDVGLLWMSRSKYGLYDTPYRADYVKCAGGEHRTGQTTFLMNQSAAFKEALKGVHVAIDETYTPDPRTYTRATFLEKFGFTDQEISSGDFPFLNTGAHPAVLFLDSVFCKPHTLRYVPFAPVYCDGSSSL